MQNTITIEDISFRTSFHGSKGNVSVKGKQKRSLDRYPLNLSAEQESLILLPKQKYSLPKLDYSIREENTSHQLYNIQQSQSMPKPSLKIRKKSSIQNQNSTKIQSDQAEKGSSSNREKTFNIKPKQSSYRQIIKEIQKHEQKQTPKNQRMKFADALPQKILTHKLKFDRMKEYLKANRNAMLARRDQSAKKRNSFSLPSINNFNYVLENRVGEVTWVKNMLLQDKPPQLYIAVPHLKRSLDQKYNAIHERQFKKLAVEKALKKRKDIVKLQRAQTQLDKQPLQMTLVLDKKKLAKKYEENLKVQYDKLMQICKKGESIMLE